MIAAYGRRKTFRFNWIGLALTVWKSQVSTFNCLVHIEFTGCGKKHGIWYVECSRAAHMINIVSAG